MFKKSASHFIFAAAALCIASSATAATFLPVTASDTADGTFGWETFTGSYAGPHGAHTTSGTGSGALSASPGGIIASTGNLYSFFSNPTWTFNLSGIESTLPLTSISLQIAAGTGANAVALTAANFSLGGITPSFVNEGVKSDGMNYYWATWESLAAANSYTITVDGTPSGNHTNFDAASISYFNTSASTVNLAMVPEPSSVLIALAGGLTMCGFRRRRP